MKRHALSSAIVTVFVLSACSTQKESQPAATTPPDATTQGITLQTLPETKTEADVEAIEVVGGRPAPARTKEMASNAAPVMMYKRTEPYVAGALTADMAMQPQYMPSQPIEQNEKYIHKDDNPIHRVSDDPVSTFALDVDTGSYSNVRRFLRQGQLPPKDAVRVEEMINYFSYQDAPAEAGHPFAIQTEVAPAPWNAHRQLLRVRIKATDMSATELPAANLVFLVDVSGSMDDPDKLPLVKSSLHMLVNQLRPQDTISLVVYAGRTQVELTPTKGSDKATIHAAIDRLSAGGSTAGGAAIELAYHQARQAFNKNGINRILLCTDGDFNVGISDTEQLKDLVSRQRDSGITLTTLGFGQGNYNDAMMEQIADVGNGNYSYIDSADEAKKVLVDELSSTFNVVAKDAKIQIEFNPAAVTEYRLIGYENRMLREEDFNNDKVDAGDVGAGKSVTALYEITPAGETPSSDPRRYDVTEQTTKAKHLLSNSNEIAFLKIRYKAKGSDTSTLIEKPLHKGDIKSSVQQTSDDFRFAAAVAAFGQILRDSVYTGKYTQKDVAQLARNALGKDQYGYRSEFIRLTEIASSLRPQHKEEAIGMND